MMGWTRMLAQVDPSQELLNHRPRRFMGFDITDTLVILGFLCLLILALFGWAYFIRKRPTDQHGAHALVRPHRSRRSRRSRHSHSSREQREESGRRVRVRRRRRRRRSEDQLPRNPTLGETGGLPPLRPEEPGEPPASQPPSAS